MSADRGSVILSAAKAVILSEAKDLLSRPRRYALHALLSLSLAGCSWFTDFKEQPKIDPWDSPSPTVPPRGNPQGSVSVYGTAAPEFMYARNPQALVQMSAIANPVPADQRSVDRGRRSYQINCSVCHGPLGMGNGAAVKYGVFPPPIGAGSNAANALSDGYIFGIIRNGRNLMPPYNRIEEDERWDLINYLRSLEGKNGIAADSSHGLPGETGTTLPGASETAPTRPAPYYNQIGSQAGAREGLMRGASTGAMPGAKATAAPGDSTKPPAPTAPAAAANKPPTP